ncbi:phosphatidate cytidylyltransferase [Metamycoplasma buccale]|uniref:phosphatidate cytidylyltransferase n=1 Tax=Metamycoplasma buccale TaxID=55602 RepID=UPI00398F2A6D
MKNTLKRAKSAIILFILILPIFFITYFGKIQGKIIGVIFYIIFSIYATYEIIQHNKINFIWNYIISILVILSWIFPFEFWYLFSDKNVINKTGLDINSTTEILKNYVFNYSLKFNIFNHIGIFINIPLITIIMAINSPKFKNKYDFFKYYFITIFVAIYMPVFSKILFVYNMSNLYYLFVIALIPIVVDTMGYFGGMLFGMKLIKRKFAPHISPKKTWEGAIISYIFGMLFVFIAMYLGKITNNVTFIYFSNYKQLIVGLLFLPAVSIIGDLLFSFIKRLMHIKDFSNLIPGHGGLMDRFDSISLVAISASAILFIV